jgi:peptide-methionine (S)-S-oxide reductase
MNITLASIFSAFLLLSCTFSDAPEIRKADSSAVNSSEANNKTKDLSNYSTAYFASGCFWCVEGVYEATKGVEEVVSGYSGGTEKNPTYQLVSSGRSRHAEVVKVYYDSTVVSYETLLKVFFGSHNPTTVDSQGPDTGPQYRSMIFYQNDAEKDMANKYIKQLLNEKVYPKIVTEVVPLVVFYEAEIYHQNFEKNNPNNSYVRGVSAPRIEKYKQNNPDLIKK